MANRLRVSKDPFVNQQIDEMLRRTKFVNFAKRGRQAVLNKNIKDDEIISEKVRNETLIDSDISLRAGIQQAKISNRERHIDSLLVGGHSAVDLLQQFLVVGSENILRFDIITITGHRASHIIPGHIGQVGGIALDNIGVGLSGLCQRYGLFRITTGFSRGSNLWLGEAGRLVNVPPTTGFLLNCGNVIDVGIVLIDIGQPIRL
ncbi:MAG: hypothetical protein DDT19_02174 [Syntrophomonadaceae bacterium]|nr:hypothetical protein [Bacillota bacterium]